MKEEFNHTGDTFDSFLEECGIREEVRAEAIKRVIAWQLEETRRSAGETKDALARKMKTSRTQVDRVLNPTNIAVSLEMLDRAAHALGKRLEIKLVDVLAT
jgi:antitoxin HicB